MICSGVNRNEDCQKKHLQQKVERRIVNRNNQFVANASAPPSPPSPIYHTATPPLPETPAMTSHTLQADIIITASKTKISFATSQFTPLETKTDTMTPLQTHHHHHHYHPHARPCTRHLILIEAETQHHHKTHHRLHVFTNASLHPFEKQLYATVSTPWQRVLINTSLHSRGTICI